MMNQNAVEINRGALAHTLAYGLTDLEAEALVARMMEVYPFPKNRPSESGASAKSI